MCGGEVEERWIGLKIASEICEVCGKFFEHIKLGN
jgi:hypothetical protein